jgi:GalNAc-alpha-(1->4)-GalNAc-alpha-(1->3)-diNAcBac-PP-undecaprenol alpha-1,4-N-acetyl-D-galactosaminyltransferase
MPIISLGQGVPRLPEKLEKLIYILPGLSPGGMERVMSELVNYSAEEGFDVCLILLSRKPRFYDIHPAVKIYEPSFHISQMSRIIFQLRDFLYLRKQLKRLPGKRALAFGGKYNAFVLLASLGTGVEVFISDRSRPGISYGTFLDLINPRVYRLSKGIIAQTHKAKYYLQKKTGHKAIEVIPNPIRTLDHTDEIMREPIILNVGRFISSKHQDWLVDYFTELNISPWKLVFLGDGPTFDQVRSDSTAKFASYPIDFKGSVKNVDEYLMKASIFAFTSTSEGFPNALAEAMAAGCACISFDCEAGPSELIDDTINGFLIREGDHEGYKHRLKQLMEDEELRLRLGEAAREKIAMFSIGKVGRQYVDFLMS